MSCLPILRLTNPNKDGLARINLRFGVILAIHRGMLILTRKSGETITIGENIEVKVLSIKGGQVRIGIDAPQSVSISREEVLLKKEKETQDNPK